MPTQCECTHSAQTEFTYSPSRTLFKAFTKCVDFCRKIRASTMFRCTILYEQNTVKTQLKTFGLPFGCKKDGATTHCIVVKDVLFPAG